MKSLYYFLSIILLTHSQVSSLASESVVSKSGDAKIRVEIGGTVDFQGVNSAQSADYNNSTLPNNPNSNSPAFSTINTLNNNDTIRANGLIQINAIGESGDGKNKYGATVITNTASSPNDEDAGLFSNQQYIFWNHIGGRFEAGSTLGASGRMRLDASKISRATGGIDGMYYYYINAPTFNTTNFSSADANLLVNSYNPVFILRPGLPNEQGMTTNVFLNNSDYDSTGNIVSNRNIQSKARWGAYSNKISYYTPKMNGFQFGVSYSPDTGNSGTLTSYQSNSTTNYQGQYNRINGLTGGSSGDMVNLISAGATYQKKIKDLVLKFGFAYENAKYEQFYANRTTASGVVANRVNSPYNDRHNLSAWGAGVQLDYKIFSLSYSYSDWGSSLAFKQSPQTDGIFSSKKSYYHTAGFALNYGVVNFSTTYLYSNFLGNHAEVLSFGSDFRIAGLNKYGLIPYFEYNIYSLKPSSSYFRNTAGNVNQVSAIKNIGEVFILGIKVIF